MKIIYVSLNEEIKIEDKIAACIGYFDGLHKGHQKLVEKAKEIARQEEIKSALITFCPDPLDVITGIKHKHIQNFDARLKIIEKMGLDYAIVFNFTKEMSRLSPREFFDQILLKLNLKALVCGFDYRYAYKGSGDYNQLSLDAKGHFDVYQIDEQLHLNEKISSTRIRNNIIEGNIALVNELLGYDYFIEGEVVHGKGNGHRLNFPTANIQYSEEIVLPKGQVYSGFVKVKQKYYRAMINFGENPTISKNNPMTLEVHIFDLNEDLYGQKLIIYFHDILREEKTFDCFEDLKHQLVMDQKEILDKEENGVFIL